MSSSFSINDSSAEEGEKEFTPTQAIFPKLSPDEKIRILEGRIMELKIRKAMAQSNTTFDAYDRNGNVAKENDNGRSNNNSLEDGGQQHLLKAILDRMNVLEKKQKQNEAETKASIEKVVQLQKEQQKQMAFIDQLLSTDQQKLGGIKMASSLSKNDSSAEEGEKEFSPTQAIFPKTNDDGEQLHLLKAILERMNVLEEKKQRQNEAETKAIFSTLSADEEEQILWARIMELRKRKTMAQSTASNDQFSQLHNEQKTLLGTISELEKQQLSPQQSEMDSDVKFNFWDANFCGDDLEISGPNCTVIHYKGNNVDGHGMRTVFAKYSILDSVVDSSNIFYTELTVKNKESSIFFGFAVKHQAPLSGAIGGRAGTFAYLCNGTFWINGSKKDGNKTFGNGAIVGCGVNFANNQVFFTRNGRRIDVPNDFLFCSNSADLLFPFVSLNYSNDKIKANFGPYFLFDVSTLC